MDMFTKGYVEAALWAETEQGGEPLDKNYTAQSFVKDAMAKIEADCRRFQEENKELLTEAYNLYSMPSKGWTPEEYAGHDLWLTRNGYGVGFWDRNLGEVGEKLTAASQKFGVCNITVYRKRLYVS